jgi:hypothetical protein
VAANASTFEKQSSKSRRLPNLNRLLAISSG